jgi:hypothetical protein
MYRISSNWTLFLKIFFPTAWMTFFGLLTLAIILADPGELPIGGGIVFKIVFVTGFIVFLLFIWLTVIRLKRVDFGDEGIYVSNYFKTYRYKYEDVSKIKENNLGLFILGTIELKDKGSFGKNIYLIISKIHYQDFLEKHPERFQHLL